MNLLSIGVRAALIMAALVLVSGGIRASAQVVQGRAMPGRDGNRPPTPPGDSRSRGGSWEDPRHKLKEPRSATIASRSELSPSSRAIVTSALKAGDSARKAGQAHYERAIYFYQLALAYDLTEARAYLGLGSIYSDLKLYEAATEEYRSAVELAPKSVEANIGLGNVYLARELYGKAAEAFKRAVEIKPKSVEARYNLGLAYLGLQNKDAALEQQKALAGLNKEAAAKLGQLINQASPQ